MGPWGGLLYVGAILSSVSYSVFMNGFGKAPDPRILLWNFYIDHAKLSREQTALVGDPLSQPRQ